MNPKTFSKFLRRDIGCVHCGVVDTAVPHHRANRGMGSFKALNNPANIIVMCSYFNGLIESSAKAAELARKFGWKLESWEDPEMVPFYADGEWWMLDDNFGNTGGDDFIPLPYMNLFITANTPPNLKLLTGDRLKLVTLVPIRDSNQNIIDTVLLPVYVEIVVRVAKTSKQNCRYRYKVRVQDKKYAEQNFSAFSWYPELLENIDKFNDYMRSCISSSSTTRANTPSSFIAEQTDTLFSRWVTQYGTKLNEDILEVYVDALDHLYRVEGALMVEASSFHGSKPKVLEYYEDNKAFTENSKKQIPDPFKFLED